MRVRECAVCKEGAWRFIRTVPLVLMLVISITLLLLLVVLPLIPIMAGPRIIVAAAIRVSTMIRVAVRHRADKQNLIPEPDVYIRMNSKRLESKTKVKKVEHKCF